MLGAFTACPELAACLAGLEALTNRIRCRQWWRATGFGRILFVLTM